MNRVRLTQKLIITYSEPASIRTTNIMKNIIILKLLYFQQETHSSSSKKENSLDDMKLHINLFSLNSSLSITRFFQDTCNAN